MTNFNERTHIFIKNISLTLYSRKGWCWLCGRGTLETRTDCYILTQVLLTIAVLLSHLGWGCPTVGHWALCLPLALTSASCPQLTPIRRTTSGTWLYNYLTPTCFRCSSAYLHRCISWLTARSRVNMLHLQPSSGVSWRTWESTRNLELSSLFNPQELNVPILLTMTRDNCYATVSSLTCSWDWTCNL